jgi:hypothetical protein
MCDKHVRSEVLVGALVSYSSFVHVRTVVHSRFDDVVPAAL